MMLGVRFNVDDETPNLLPVRHMTIWIGMPLAVPLPRPAGYCTYM